MAAVETLERKSSGPDLPRLVLLAGVWLVYLAFGLAVASLAPLVPQIAGDMGISDGQMGLILGAWPCVYILFALPAGRILDRIGVGPGVGIAVVFMVLSLLLRAEAGGALGLGLAVAVLGLGGPLISVGAPKLVAGLFDGRARGMAMGVYITGPYIGGMLALGLMNSLLLPMAGGDWRAALRILAGLVLGVGMVWGLIVLAPAVRRALAGIATTGKYDPKALRDVLRAPSIRLILMIAIGIFAVNHALNGWLPAVLIAGGMGAAEAGWWASVPALVGVGAALVIPHLVATDPARQMRALALLTAGMMMAAALLSQELLLAPALVLQGLARGAMMTLAMMLMLGSRDVPQDRLGLAGGLFFTTAEVGGLLGPALFGQLAQVSAGFTLPLIGVAGVCAVQLWLLARLWRRGM